MTTGQRSAAPFVCWSGCAARSIARLHRHPAHRQQRCQGQHPPAQTPARQTGRARVALADQLVRASADALARAHELTLPLLIMHGADDRLTSPNGSRLLHERARSPDKTLIFWPGLRHELFNEPRRDAVLARVVTWLDERVSGAPADVAHLRSAGRGDR